MSTAANSINAATAGIVGNDAVGNFSGSPMTQYEVVLGGSSTSTLTQVSGVGTSGQVLTSNGAAMNPTWQNSTGAGIQIVTGTLTSAQIKALHAVQQNIVSAPGVGSVLVPLSLILKLNYGGNNAFVSGGGAVINLWWGSTTATNLTPAGSIITGTATAFTQVITSGLSTPNANTGVDNKPLTLWNSSATEYTGNASNDNTVSYSLMYYVVTI